MIVGARIARQCFSFCVERDGRAMRAPTLMSRTSLSGYGVTFFSERRLRGG